MIHLILYRPEIPSNTGNIMRTAVATGATLHLIGPLTFPLDEPSLKRAGLDYIEQLKWHYYPDLESFEKAFPGARYYLITRYGEVVFSDEDFSDVKRDIFLMFGSESSGLPDAILTDARHQPLRIPMTITSRSLNLSNAVAIVVYEVLRQQKYFNLATVETIKGRDFLKRKKRQ